MAAEPVSLAARCVFAAVYALAGALIGGSLVYLALKFAALAAASPLLSPGTLDIVVVAVSVVSAAVAATGYLHQR